MCNSAGQLWTAGYIDSIGDPTADLRSNIAAESRAKIIYERLINITSDPGVKDALGFLMTREVAHQKSFEKALYSIENNFPPGKLPAMPEYADKYYNMSRGDGDSRGPWNQGAQWEYLTIKPTDGPVNGGDGNPSVKLAASEIKAVNAVAARTQSKADSNPLTGADLSAGTGTRKTTTVTKAKSKK